MSTVTASDRATASGREDQADSSLPVTTSPDPTDPRNQRVLAPHRDGEIVSRPPLQGGIPLALQNSQRFLHAQTVVSGRSLPQFRSWARQVLLEKARAWMDETLGIAPDATSTDLLFITGHQPQLNHAGVWMKNVAVAQMAAISGGTGLNLIVDNDLAGPQVLRVPAGTRDEPHFEELPFDAPQPTGPWEEMQLQDPELFAAFPENVRAAMARWGIEPSLGKYWRTAVELSEKNSNSAVLLSACRIAQERDWGLQNLELPISVLCQTEPFLAFVAHLSLNFRKLFADYNAAIQQYRKKYRVRNHRHPVPELEQLGDRYELPFWYWQAGSRERSRVFARRSGSGVELYADEVLLATVSSTDDLSPLLRLQQQGRLRTKALTTTLFARVCLGDLFVHGIGGARYDEITDHLIESFFQIAAPGFMTLTATLKLPLEPFPVHRSDVGRLKNQIRRMRFSGSEDEASAQALAGQIRRAELLAAAREDRAAGYSRRERRVRAGEARRRHRELVRIQKDLALLARDAIASKEEELKAAEQQVRANALLESREFAAVLLPEQKLIQLVQDVRKEIQPTG